MEQMGINMSCGQTDIRPECLETLAMPVRTPVYYPGYQSLEAETVALLKKLLHAEQGDVTLMLGTATYGLEAAIWNAIEPGDTVITANTGVFGHLQTDIAQAAGANVIELPVTPGQAVRPEAVEQALKEHPETKLVGIVYSDTSTGVLSPVWDIGRVVRRFPDAVFLVDAVSAFGGVAVRFDEWHIDFCCTTSQKCLNAPQGVAIVAISPTGWKRIDSRSKPIGLRSMNFRVWKGSFVLTRALHTAVKAVFDEGPEEVYRRHRVAGRAMREAMRALGLPVLASDADASPTCTKVAWPSALNMEVFRTRLEQEYGIAMAGERFGTMGYFARPQYVLPTISAVERCLRDFQIPVELGRGLQAANRVFAEGME
ncbi:MAG: alanine--glyoxylate aminotransferase family protein [candidate division Zixibacteria bacterium]|nr:alanine--glyoxylate aminotransferase family protein [candidate division Zixibacteria bacterium]